MPSHKRRKLSLEDHDGKESDKHSACGSSAENAYEKETSDNPECKPEVEFSSTGSGKRKTFKKSQASAAAAATTSDDNDGSAASSASTGAATATTTKSGRVIKLSKAAQLLSDERKKRHQRLSQAQNAKSITPPTITSSTGVTSATSSAEPVVGLVVAVDSQNAARKVTDGQNAPAKKGSEGRRKKPQRPKQHSAKPVTPSRSKKGSHEPRAWESWVDVEMTAFFDGLMEHGKNFEAIYTLVQKRSIKHGIEPSKRKNLEQVRQNYYRLWGKISKVVKISPGVKKTTRELYGLINYSQVRKVFKRMDEKAANALNELIFRGICKVYLPYPLSKKKKRPKRWHVLKTPVCKALKKLNNIEGPDVQEKSVKELPRKVLVELMPTDQATWVHVQNKGHNPRVRLQIPPKRSLLAIFKRLETKWKGSKGRLRESLGSDSSEELVLALHHSYPVEQFNLFLTLRKSSHKPSDDVLGVSFNSYNNNILRKMPKVRGEEKRKSGCGPSTATAPSSLAPLDDPPKQHSDNSSDAEIYFADLHTSTKVSRYSARTSLLPRLNDLDVPVDDNAVFPDTPFSSPQKDSNSMDPDDGVEEGDDDYDDMNESKCLETDSMNEDEEAVCEKEGVLDEVSPGKSREDDREKEGEQRDLNLEKLAEGTLNGFTREIGRFVTIAHLDLMLEEKGYIRLEYQWRRKASAASGHGAVAEDVERMTNMMRRLSSMANMEYRDIVQRGKIAAGQKGTHCILCSHSLERPPRHTRTMCDAATETDPDIWASTGAGFIQPALLNSSGTIVGISSPKTLLGSTRDLVPDTDGVFRVPMPIPSAISLVRSGGPHRMSTQPSIMQLIQPLEPRMPKPNFLLPRKRQRKSAPTHHLPRPLLPKGSPSQVVIIATEPAQTFSSLHSVQPSAVGSGSPPAHAAVAMSASPAASQPVTTAAHPVLSQVDAAGLLASSSPGLDGGAGLTTAPTAPEVRLNTVALYNMPLLTSSPVKLESRGSFRHVAHGTSRELPGRAVAESTSQSSLTSIFDLSYPMPACYSSKLIEMDKQPGTEICGSEETAIPPTAASDNSFRVKVQFPPNFGSGYATLNTPKHSTTPPCSPRSSPIKIEPDCHWVAEALEDYKMSLGSTVEDYKMSLGSSMEGMHADTSNISISEFFLAPSLGSATDGLASSSAAVDVLVAESSSMSFSEFFSLPTSSASESAGSDLTSQMANLTEVSTEIPTGKFSLVAAGGLVKEECKSRSSAFAESCVSTAPVATGIDVVLPVEAANQQQGEGCTLLDTDISSRDVFSSASTLTMVSSSGSHLQVLRQPGLELDSMLSPGLLVAKQGTLADATSQVTLNSETFNIYNGECTARGENKGCLLQQTTAPEVSCMQKKDDLSYLKQERAAWEPESGLLDLGPHGPLNLGLGQLLVKTEPREAGEGVVSSHMLLPASSSYVPNLPSWFGEGSQDSIISRLDVESAVSSVLAESSVDYSCNFETLAQQLADNSESQQP